MRDPTVRPSVVVRGQPASRGIAIGRIVVVRHKELPFERRRVRVRNVKREQKRFRVAVQASIDQLRELRHRLAAHAQKQAPSHIIEAHELILQDEMLVDDACRRITADTINAEWALEKTLDRIRGLFLDLDDEIYRERASDVEFIGQRILRSLLGRPADRIPEVPKGRIVVAHDLSPAEAVQMLHLGAVGLAVDVGSRTSHTAIVARSLEVPAVVGLSSLSEQAASGDTAIVDGDEGVCVLHPGRADLSRYRRRRSRAVVRAQELLRNRERPAVTTDGVRIRIRTNLDLLEEVNSMFANGGEGVGLFRTEFLYLNRRDLPGEDEQLAFYRRLLERVHPFPTTVRTCDLGGDKFVAAGRCSPGRGPLGGLRAIRLSLRREDLFRVQLRALLRASVHGRLRILIPLVTCVSEMRRVREILDELRDELRAEGHAFDPHIEVGPMVETPAAAQIADLLAPSADFLSIGTNDLIQYTLALAREDQDVSYLYHPLHPAILRLIRATARAAAAAGIRVSICGEMASEPLYAQVLLGLGLTELSMVPRAVPAVKEIIRGSSLAEARALVAELDELPMYQEVESAVVRRMHARFPDILRRG